MRIVRTGPWIYDDSVTMPVDISVGFEDGRTAWFAADLVDLLDHGAGTVATVGDHSFIRTADGEWLETPPAAD